MRTPLWAARLCRAGRARQGARSVRAPVMLMPCLPAECAGLTPLYRAGGRPAIIGLDAMRSFPKTLLASILLALAAQQLCAPSTAAQDAPAPPTSSGAHAGGKSAGKSGAKRATKSTTKSAGKAAGQGAGQSAGKSAKARAKSGVSPQPARQAATVPAPAPQALVATPPMAEEAEHVAQYDLAIAPARDHALPAADVSTLREA